jgi:Icc-related predicted phosphoesterase
MTRVEWLLAKVPEPIGSDDFYMFYDTYCEEFGHVANETYKRYCRAAMEAYREEAIEENTIEKDLKSKDVLLDKLNETENKLELSLKSYKIQDVETAAELAGIDLSNWKCVGKTVRASQNNKNPWYIVEGKFKPRDLNDVSPEEMVENFREILLKHEPPTDFIEPPKHKKLDNMALFNFYDHHIGKRIQADVTGNGKEWTTAIAKESMLCATDYFIDRTKDEVQKVMFVLGNDLLNIDNPENTTTKGTPQRNDVDYKHLILESEDLLITVLEKLLHYFTVEVVVVPGNHDTNLVFLLGEILKHYFSNNPNIEIDNDLPLLKYKQFGEVALGFVHGSEQIKKKYVLPMMMMQQRPDLAKCRYKEFHTGHLHQTRNTQITEVAEEYGILMRILPTLSPTCEWANGKGFQGQQATECIVYNRDYGPIATYRYTE